MSRYVPVVRRASRLVTAVAAAAFASSLACATARGAEGASPSAPDTWAALPLLPFTYGVSAGGGLASDGVYLYAADFSGDADADTIDLNGNLARDAGEALWELATPNGSVRFARYDPITETWAALPTLHAEGVDGDAFSAGNLTGPLFVAAGRLYYYQFRAGPNVCALYSYDLAGGLSGVWTAVWEKPWTGQEMLFANAGMVGLAHAGNPLILHHTGGGDYSFARSDGFASGGVHTRRLPAGARTRPAHRPRRGPGQRWRRHPR